VTPEQEFTKLALPLLKRPDDERLRAELFQWLKTGGYNSGDVALPLFLNGLGMVHERLAALEAQNAKALPSCSWKGVFVAGQVYRPGDLVTRSGGLWLCTDQTTSAPSGDPATWKLIVKEGQAR
jgi:hypothetical protein